MEKFVVIFVVLLCLKDLNVLGEEVSFYDDDGGFFTLTITGGCYTFEPKLVRRANTVEVKTGCFNLYKGPNCKGEQTTVRRGTHNLKEFGFNKAVSSVELCDSKAIRREYHQEFSAGKPKPSFTMQGGQLSRQEVWNVALEEHNKYRRLHGLPEFRGNRQMHQDAQEWADYLANSNRFEPTTLGKYGNNIASSFRTNEIDAIRDVVKRWYNKGEGSTKAILWEDTTDIGIGIAWNDREKEWVVNAFYSPPVTRSGSRGYFMPPTQAA